MSSPIDDSKARIYETQDSGNNNMHIHGNKAAIVLGGGSLIVSLAVGYFLGWYKSRNAGSGSREMQGIMLWGALLAISDLAFRLRHLPDVNVPPPPSVITRQGPMPTRPQPAMNILNLFLSGEKGAQFFWVFPGWILGVAIPYFASRPGVK